MFEGIGKNELIVIAAISLLFFGGKKLPELGRGLGEVVGEFRKAFSEETPKKSNKNTK